MRPADAIETVELQGVSKWFVGPGSERVTALANVSLQLRAREFVVLVGPNGSGKSTLLNLIAGQLPADTGKVVARVGGQSVDWHQSRHRNRFVARIHQDPTRGTVDDLSVTENIRLAGLRRVPFPFFPAVTNDVRSNISSSLAATAIAAKGAALVNELSYGQRQLLALEMAAARNSQVLLLDEPTASLDANNAARCVERVRALHRDLRALVVFVTHDMALAAQQGDRLIVLKEGKILRDISGVEKQSLGPEDVFRLVEFANI